MGKRKQSIPQKTSEDKRQCMTWSMVDGHLTAGSMTVLSDDDPSLIQERRQAELETSAKNQRKATEQSTTENQRLPFISEQLAATFEENLQSCLFSLVLYCQPSFQPGEWHAELGKFTIKLFPHEQFPDLLQDGLPQCSQCWFYISKKKDRCMIYFELDENNKELSRTNSKAKKSSMKQKPSMLFFFADTSFSFECLEAVQSKKLCHLVISNYNPDSMEAQVRIFVTSKALIKLNYSSEYAKPSRNTYAMQTLMAEYYGFLPQVNVYKESSRDMRRDVEMLYSSVKSGHQNWTAPVDCDVQHPNLKPHLRQYQREAVEWMLTRENIQQCQEKSKNDIHKDISTLHGLYQEFKTLDNQTLYYNSYLGWLVKEKPLCVKPLPGGILADEMGLGKTVEVLACMLAHPRTGVHLPDPLPVIEIIQDGADSGTEDIDQDEYKENSTDISMHSGDGNSSVDTHVDIWDKIFENVLRNEAIEGSKSESIDSNINHYNTDPETGCHLNELQDSQFKRMTKKSEEMGSQEFAVTSSKQDLILNLSENADAIVEKRTNLEVESININKSESITNETLDGNGENRTSLDQLEVKNVEAINENKSDVIQTFDENVEIRPELENVQTFSDEKSKADTSEIVNDVKTAYSKKKSKPRKQKSFCELVPIDDVLPSPNGFFSDKPIQQKEYFECICGEKEASWTHVDNVKVQCTQCGLWQHSACVNYPLQDPYRGQYLCPHCHVLAPPVESGATLIVSPSSICHQWVEEITKHIKEKSIKVFVYTGVSKLRFIQPRTLASNDIVITTYETLRKEIDFVDLPHSNSEAGRRFRHPKRFMAIPSPLIAVQWWRICLDEAQMVERVTTRTADMALRLTAVNRWCVTGTPVQKDIQDLYGLLVFLGVDPYWVQGWWKRLIYDPFLHGVTEPLYKAIGAVMWRTAKKDVIQQINLPGQSEEVKWLTFSPVEDHFYRRQYQTCMKEAARSLLRRTDGETKLSSLDRQTLHSVLHPLLKMRQACCHPQAVRGAFLPLQKSTMTMEELLESLTKKTSLECEEAHRQVVAALNGLAGLDILQLQYADAVEKYREVFRSMDEHQGGIRTDELQQLHALHNLREVLNLKPEGVAPTLRDDQLEKQAGELREKYMVKVAAKVDQKEEALEPVQESVEEIQHELVGGDTWWMDLLQWLTYIHQDEAVIERIHEHLRSTANKEINSISNRFRDVRGLEYILDSQLQDLERCHGKLTSAIVKLRKKPSQTVIDDTVECCLRPQDKILKICPYCKCDELFSEYESKLFSISEKGIFGVEEESSGLQVNTKRQGSWADSELEKALKTILSFVKMLRGDEELISFGTIHIKLFDTLKKEFKMLRAVWLALHEQISAIDELSMATTRLRFRLPEEPKTDPPQLNVIEAFQIETQRMKLISDRTVGQNDLRRKLGQLLYLRNMAKNPGDDGSGLNPEPCPVCQRELGQEWTVLQCGHCYCLDCIRIMVEQYSFGGRLKSLRCAMCRQLTRHTDISNVSTKPSTSSQDGDTISVKGSHSTKIEAIIRCLKEIQSSDSTAKSLVFSTWTDVLDKISQALIENDISHRCLQGGRKFQENLYTFRHDEDVKALLLPVHSGANGLNLIEATHVLLVEPILNGAEEQQAIGRVHRIGQTKPIKVLRFLVRGTIEEKIFSLFNTSRDETDGEENELTVGDLITLLQEDQGEVSNIMNTDFNIPAPHLPQSISRSIHPVQDFSQNPGQLSHTSVQQDQFNSGILNTAANSSQHPGELSCDPVHRDPCYSQTMSPVAGSSQNHGELPCSSVLQDQTNSAATNLGTSSSEHPTKCLDLGSYSQAMSHVTGSFQNQEDQGDVSDMIDTDFNIPSPHLPQSISRSINPVQDFSQNPGQLSHTSVQQDQSNSGMLNTAANSSQHPGELSCDPVHRDPCYSQTMSPVAGSSQNHGELPCNSVLQDQTNSGATNLATSSSEHSSKLS